jgi:hypothetical protein
MIDPTITSSYHDRINVFAHDRNSSTSFLWGFSNILKGTKGHAKDDIISNLTKTLMD